MPERGKKLREYRKAWGWTVRRVEEVSRRIAEVWNDPEYIIDCSYVSRIERGETRLSCVSFAKVQGMVEMFSGGPRVWNSLRPKSSISLFDDLLSGPDRTRVIREGRYDEKTSALIHTAFADSRIPEKTIMSPFKGRDAFDAIDPFQDRKRYLRAIVGLKDTCLRNKLTPGTMLIVDRECDIVPKYDFFLEDERPMFLIDTHVGMYCCWCDSLDDGKTIKVVPHPSSPLSVLPHRQLHEPLKIDRDVNVIGEVVFWGMESQRHQRRRIGRP